MELFWNAKVLLFQERAASSEALQPLDVACYGPLSRRLREESAHYTVRFAGRQMSQFEWPAVYCIAKKQALTAENIVSGFRATGIWPRMTVDEWLDQYGNQRGYIMEDPTKTSDIRSFVAQPSRLFDALDLAKLKPKKRIAPTPLPPPRKKRKIAPKTTQDGLPLAVAKILNKPSRISKLREAERMRVEQYKILALNRKKREIAKANRIAESKKKKEEREKKALEVHHITQALKAEFGEEVKFSIFKVRIIGESGSFTVAGRKG